jgi:ankyrin repeat protein
MFAAGGGHNDTTRFLIEQKADVNVVVQATAEYMERVAKAIAEGKEDVEPHKDGVTALLVACQGGHMGTAQLLVEAGAELRVADDEEVTPLLAAVKGKHLSLANYLLQHGADPNDSWMDEKTSKPHNLLMDAVVDSQLELALLLVSQGANLSYVDEDGVSVITQAAYQGQLAVEVVGETARIRSGLSLRHPTTDLQGTLLTRQLSPDQISAFFGFLAGVISSLLTLLRRE